MNQSVDSAGSDSHKERARDSVTTCSELNNYDLDDEEDNKKNGPPGAPGADSHQDGDSSSLTPTPEQSSHQEETDNQGEDAANPT